MNAMKTNGKNRNMRTKKEIDFAIHEALASVGKSQAVKIALERLVTQVRGKTRLLSPTRRGAPAGWVQAAYFVNGLLALAHYHAQLLREPETWEPPCQSPLRQFGSLATHLLANRPAPQFMALVWLQEPSEKARQQQKWFRHMALDCSIRGTDIPYRLTKKMAFLFTQAPDHLTVDEALSWCWNFNGEEKKRIVYPAGLSWRRRRRFNGKRANFPSKPGLWPRIGVADLRCVEPSKHEWSLRYWTICQIRRPEDLIAEGKALHHCVATYEDLCADGTATIWSMMCHGKISSRRVLTIQVDPATRTIVQARGKWDRPATRDARLVMKRWADQEGLAIGRWV